MKQSMFLTISLALLLICGYSNCAPSSDSTSQGVFSVTSDCSYCDGEQDADYGQVSLKIGSPDPLVIQRGDIGFNTGGDCFSGFYPDNEIKWKLTDVNGGSPTMSSFKSRCVDGRFQFLVQFPANFNYDIPHTLEVAFTVYDENGIAQEPVVSSVNVISVDF